MGYLDETLNWSMDWDLWIRIGRRFPVRYLPTPLAEVRIHPDTKTNQAGLAKLFEMHRIVRRHTRRRVPPVLLIHGGGTLYRMLCQLLGRTPEPAEAPDGARFDSLRRWAHRVMNRVIDTGQLPWERRPDPGLRRVAPESADASRAKSAP